MQRTFSPPPRVQNAPPSQEGAPTPSPAGSGSASSTVAAMTPPGSKPEVSTTGRSERSLAEYTPKFYMAVLEGTLLTNGDLKGSWRLRQEDTVKNEFCMVLMDRGVYDGGFNIGIPRRDPSRPSVQEIHDKWHSFEWCESSNGFSNIWGRGRNVQFGECYLVGVHDVQQGRILMYKVGEAEMLRAKAFARAAPVVAPLPAVQPTPPPATCAAATAETAKPAIATGGQKRRRSYPRTRGIFAATAMRVPACPSTQSPNGGGSGSCSNPNGSSGGSPAGASGGSPAGASGENGVHGGTARAKSVLPGLVGVGAVGETKSSTVATAAAAAAAAAADATTTQGSVALSTTGSTAPRNIDELADLTMLGARLKREKLQITQQAGALRKSLEARKAEQERKVSKGKLEEAMLIQALQELRLKMMGDEHQLEAVAAHLKRAESEEQCALGLWNAKWENQVAPFIAQCEQEVKKKAQELEKKTREAEKERYELEKELERLHRVKKIGDLTASDAPPVR